MQNLIVRITQENFSQLENSKIGCFILPDSTNTAFAEAFIEKAHANNKLVLAQGANSLEFYLTHHTDGLIIDTAKEEKPQKTVKAVQKKAPKAILGVICRNRRHEAMLVSECEPDFVIFKIWADGIENNKEFLAWYNELFLIQSAAQIEEPCNYADLTTDFVILNDADL